MVIVAGALVVPATQWIPLSVEPAMTGVFGEGSKDAPAAAQRAVPPQPTTERLPLKKGLGWPIA